MEQLDLRSILHDTVIVYVRSRELLALKVAEQVSTHTRAYDLSEALRFARKGVGRSSPQKMKLFEDAETVCWDAFERKAPAG